MSVDPTGQDLKRFLAEDPGGPVVMLNLLRYADGGAESYAQYAEKIVPFLERVGARAVAVLGTETRGRPREDTLAAAPSAVVSG